MSEIADKEFAFVSELVEKEHASSKSELEEKIRKAKEKALSELKS